MTSTVRTLEGGKHPHRPLPLLGVPVVLIPTLLQQEAEMSLI